MIKLIAFDLDGTLTQHKTPLDEKNKSVLNRLGEKYKLLMVGAGQCRRIFNQLGEYPIDIIGNYGLQYAKYDAEKKDIIIERIYDKILREFPKVKQLYHIRQDTEDIRKPNKHPNLA